MFRSETMRYYDVQVPYDSAWKVLNCLGQLSEVQFEDNNPVPIAQGRPFQSYVKRCEDATNHIAKVQQLAKTYNIELQNRSDLSAFYSELEDELVRQKIPNHTYLDHIEQELKQRLETIDQHRANHNHLTN